MNIHPGSAHSKKTLRRLTARTVERSGLLIAMVALAMSMGLSGCSSSSASNLLGAGGVNGNPAQSNLVSGAGVTLNWNPSISSGVVGYNVYRGTGSGGPYSRMNSSLVTVTTYNDNTIQSGQTYYYVVTSVNLSDVESAYSNEVVASIP